MRDGETDAAFTGFARGRSTALLRAAVPLTGGDRSHAEDLLQTCWNACPCGGTGFTYTKDLD